MPEGEKDTRTPGEKLRDLDAMKRRMELPALPGGTNLDNPHEARGDYLAEDFDPEAAAAIREAQSDMTKKVSATTDQLQHTIARKERYKKKAVVDELTGIENRRSFDKGLLSAVNRADRAGSKIFLMMIDIDDFKKLNDTKGHQCGDYVLRELGKLLGENGGVLRKSEKPFRYGGEEFGIIVDAKNPDEKDLDAKDPYTGVVKLGERVQKALRNLELVYNGEKLDVTLSIGVGAFDDIDKTDIKVKDPERDEVLGKSIINLADTALYAAKYAGKDTVVTARDSDPDYEAYNRHVVMDGRR